MSITPCKDQNKSNGLETIKPLLKDVIDAQISLGMEAFRLLGASAGLARDALGQLDWPKARSCCDIPDPCWMPQGLGEATCRLAPGGVGELKLIVTNQDFRAHAVSARAAGPDAGLVQFTPQTTSLGPKDRVTIVARFTAPGQAGAHEVLIWITGCREHYLRWVIEVADVKAGRKSDRCCHEVTVEDGVDYVVHWYDHFYCQRSGFGSDSKAP